MLLNAAFGIQLAQTIKQCHIIFPKRIGGLFYEDAGDTNKAPKSYLKDVILLPSDKTTKVPRGKTQSDLSEKGLCLLE